MNSTQFYAKYVKLRKRTHKTKSTYFHVKTRKTRKML